MIPDPIFIIGTERSGSNLLRLLLNAHPAIAIPHPPHIMRDVAPFVHLYGNLTQDKNFRALVRDVTRVVSLHFSPWPCRLNEEMVFRNSPSRSLYGLYVALQEQYLHHTGKTRWGCKSTFMYRHIGEILDHHRSPRFVHLVRDPRDVAASAEHSIFSRYHPYKEGQLWAQQQEEISAWEGLRSEGKMLRMRYEDLVNRPELELKKIMGFLKEEYHPEQLQCFRSSEADRLASLSESWRNCASPISSRSVGRFRSQLSKEEIAHVEFFSRSLMTAYGYELESSPMFHRPSLCGRARIELSEKRRMFAAEIRSMRKDKNFFLRWKKWLFIQYLKASRRVSNG